jgi:hypothetical protein
MRSRIASIENLISQDPGRRKIFALVQRDHLRLAALSLRRAERVLIVSGFPILKAGTGETDGPPGAVALGQALTRLGIQVAYLTDRLNAPLFQALGVNLLLKRTPDLLERENISHLVAVECPGRARDGRYYNMRGEEMTCIETLDELFLEAETKGLVTIGIGDGGNEVGMGRVFQDVRRAIPRGGRIASTVLTDYVIVAGVSNWGAYGLVGALSILTEKDLLPSVRDVIRSIEDLVRAGAVDGVSGERKPCVDGLPLTNSLEILQEIRRHVLPSPLDRIEDVSVGVLGLGRTGRAAARLLLGYGARVRLSDHRSVRIPKDLANCPVERGAHSIDFLGETDLVVLSPGVPPTLSVVRTLRERGIPVMSELEVAYQLGRPSLIAVTGSRGKRSTVRTLRRLLADAGETLSIGGNKGRPLSQLLREGGEGYMALAVSSFQLESIVHFRPRVAIILNVGGLHLDRHRDEEETVRIKSRIFMNQGPADFLILNHDDPFLRPLADKHWGETLFVSACEPQDRGIWIQDGRVRISLDHGTLDLGATPEKYPENLLSAILTVSLLGLSPDKLCRTLEKWTQR